MPVPGRSPEPMPHTLTTGLPSWCAYCGEPAWPSPPSTSASQSRLMSSAQVASPAPLMSYIT